ncbi:MAG: hypothetical protein D6691_10830 [Candidatus Hydrogenedentota bacterium]|nr:MAG: hypothetical protein D6691_10830 [Candidatus Hydrogenedentota bacterium]
MRWLSINKLAAIVGLLQWVFANGAVACETGANPNACATEAPAASASREMPCCECCEFPLPSLACPELCSPACCHASSSEKQLPVTWERPVVGSGDGRRSEVVPALAVWAGNRAIRVVERDLVAWVHTPSTVRLHLVVCVLRN